MTEPILNVERVWWRNVPKGEFFNVERHPSVTQGGQGALYFEIPKSLVVATLDFLDLDAIGSLPFTIQAGVFDGTGDTGPLEFQTKAGGRMRIARQNRQMTGSQRHPGWIPSRGFPSAPDGVRNSSESDPFFPEGGLRIYIAKTFEGHYYAGCTTGTRPANMSYGDPNWDLYSQYPAVGGVIDAG
jgi:hypothetical protein